MKKIISLAVVCCLALAGVVFSSCSNEQKSSYLYTVQLAPVDQDQAMAMQFELNGLPIIVGEMQKVSDQAGSIIFKDTRKNADRRAKDAFAAGIAKLREGGVGSFAGLIVGLYLSDPDTNKPVEIDRVTL